METAKRRRPSRRLPARGPRRAGRIDPQDIPTLEIEVPASEIAAARARAELQRAYTRRSSRRASQQIVALVGCGLLAAVGIALLLERPDSGPDGPTGRTAEAPRTVNMPRLILLSELSETPGGELLQSITELLAAPELPDEVTIDFAIQSLKTMQLANPESFVARQRLVSLTRRLANEARVQWDQGNTALAARLIRQASTSGVATEYVRHAADYIAAPREASSDN